MRCGVPSIWLSVVGACLAAATSVCALAQTGGGLYLVTEHRPSSAGGLER
jgi:hypothetical protein